MIEALRPIHKVRITKPFYLGKYLVTQEQWEAVMGSNPSYFKGPKNPVESGELGRLPGVHRETQCDSCRRKGPVRLADRSAMGVCVPCGEHDEVLFRG